MVQCPPLRAVCGTGQQCHPAPLTLGAVGEVNIPGKVGHIELGVYLDNCKKKENNKQCKNCALGAQQLLLGGVCVAGDPSLEGEQGGDAHQHLLISTGSCHCHLPVGAEAAWPANG